MALTFDIFLGSIKTHFIYISRTLGLGEVFFTDRVWDDVIKAIVNHEKTLKKIQSLETQLFSECNRYLIYDDFRMNCQNKKSLVRISRGF